MKVFVVLMIFFYSLALWADTTAVIHFDATYGKATNAFVQGEIVRGEWIKVEYNQRRMERLIYNNVYGEYHCYGYGPSCAVETGKIGTYYRFDGQGKFYLAQGQHIYIPETASRLEIFFMAPNPQVTLYSSEHTETRRPGTQYDSNHGGNFHFFF